MVKNFIYISPQFPRNYAAFVVALRKFGLNVLGIGSDPFGNLSHELKQTLTEYYQVPVMDDYAEVLKAGHYFKNKYGRIDRVESHTEYWLSLDAALRDDLQVWGKKTAELPWIKHKSKMKEVFQNAGIAVARGMLLRDLDSACGFAKQVGYPVIVKPDQGVGAYATFKVQNEQELETFYRRKPPIECFIEEFIPGTIHTFDGLTNHDGEIVYLNSLVYSQGIMEVVNADQHVAYWTACAIAPDLEEAGRKAVKAFDIRERFFHLEFFRRSGDNRILGLEVNVRPPGGLTTDMWNYADDIDIYREWARVVVCNRFEAAWSRKYHVGYLGRKDNLRYARSHEEVLNRCGSKLVHWERLSTIFRAALGDTGYLVRSSALDEIKELIAYVHQTA
jgi:hypothetical protein